MEFGFPLKLCNESATRWGSRQKIIARVLEQQKPIFCLQVLAADKQTLHLVTQWQDIEVWESMNEALAPLVDFTDSLSGESYVTLSYVKPVFHLLCSQHLHVSEEDTPLTKQMKTKIMAYLDEKYSDPDTENMRIPRLKPLKQEQWLKSWMSVSSIQGLQKYQVQFQQVQKMPLENIHRLEKSSGNRWGASRNSALLQETAPSHLTEKEKVESELERCFKSPDADSECNQLLWWKENEHQFPRLSLLVKKYLCIPATSSPSERIFSSGGNVVTCTRTTLKPHKVNQLVFLASELYSLFLFYLYQHLKMPRAQQLQTKNSG
ncbi:zinc finger BED domain-containing protein 1-like [Fundulus heteroclitus]|uniref:zinc finger BED domain-containing protein 1-like n=1 Tax=Fundulus heteroclitus TaxID=8078 RepID=UPI00165ABB48|nr:zinc finger BED domain-containing protein 1-like [Fundulus heteroclitus]